MKVKLSLKLLIWSHYPTLVKVKRVCDTLMSCLGRKYFQFLKIVVQAIRFRLKNSQRILVIGDSHASFLVTDKLKKNSIHDNFWGFWAGPRLLFSVGKMGLNIDKAVELIFKLISPTATLFLFGEIDVRTRSSELNKSKFALHSVVGEYLSTLSFFCRRYNLGFPCVLQPLPPSDFQHYSLDFPTRGTIEERLKASAEISEALGIQHAAFGLQFIAFPQSLVEVNGTILEARLIDSCHTNSITNEIWRSEILSNLAIKGNF